MYKFLHTADIHLDSPLLNLDRYDGAPVDAFRSATRRAFDNVVELAVAEQVRFLLIAGDLYDGDCRDFNTPLHFRLKMEELRSHGIQVYIIQGNHDAESKMRKAFQLRLPNNVRLFGTDKPETVRIDEVKVAIHGQGFAQREVNTDLSEQYPPPVRGWLNIGLLHTSCGLYEAHERYAPSSVAGLTQKGYDYWALGHIHKYEKLAGPRPWIVYPGNPQGRHIREEGPRGCVVATVEDDRITTRWQAVDVLRWRTCAIDASECDEADAVVAEAEAPVERLITEAEGRPLAVRLEVTGASRAHRELSRCPDYWDRRLREAMVDRFDDRVWVEKIKFCTRSLADVPAWESGDDPIWQIVEGITDLDVAHAALAEVRGHYEQLYKQLPRDPRLTEAAHSSDERWLDALAGAALLDDVKELLISRLLQSGDGA